MYVEEGGVIIVKVFLPIIIESSLAILWIDFAIYGLYSEMFHTLHSWNVPYLRETR